MTNYRPLATAVITAVFAYQVLTRWQTGGRPTNLLIWGVGLIFYFIASLAAALYSIFGWQEAWGEINFKIWYFFGAVLAAPWMGQGTVFLLWRSLPLTTVPEWFSRLVRIAGGRAAPMEHSATAAESADNSGVRKIPIAVPTLIALAAGSLFAAYWVFSAPVDPTPLLGDAGELTGKGVLPVRVRIISPIFNIYGIVTLIGGALSSAFRYWRRRAHFDRMVGNIMIAAGMVLAAAGGTLNRFGIPGLNLGLLAGATFAYWGFVTIAGARVVEISIESRAESSASS